MARVTHVKKAQKDYPEHGIKKGEEYYWWKFRYGGKHFSKTYPKPSQLTQSEFLSQVYDFNDRISGLSTGDFNEPEDLQAWKEELVGELETLRDEQEEKKDNMPEGLQEGPTGELLQERYDGIDELINELEGIDCDDFDFDEDAKKEEIIDELKDKYEGEEEDWEPSEDDVQEKVNGSRQEAVEDWLQEKIDELSGLSYSGS